MATRYSYRVHADDGHVRVRQAIVLVQIAIATTLVAGGALLLSSFLRLTAVPPGFNPDRTLLADVALPGVRYARGARGLFFAALVERVSALPGVEGAGAGGPLPLSGLDGLLRFAIPSKDAIHRPIVQRAYVRWATPGYFKAMGIELRAGRALAETDTARRHRSWSSTPSSPGAFSTAQDPLGKRISTSLDAKTFREVIGVVGSVRQSNLERDEEPHLYLPQSQVPQPGPDPRGPRVRR